MKDRVTKCGIKKFSTRLMEEMGLFILLENMVGFCPLSEVIPVNLLKRLGLFGT